MNAKTKGTICGIIAAVTYGTNPLGALSLYADGINSASVLFYRYGLAVVLLAAVMLLRRNESLRVSWRELRIIATLGILFAASSLSLYLSFHYMDAGIASTILFVYPIMVAVIMALFFHEKTTLIIVISIALSLCGIGLLYRGGNGATLSTVGVLLVLVSSLTYALYIVIVNRSTLAMSPYKLSLYVMAFGALTIVLYSFTGDGNRLQLLTSWSQWGYAWLLAILPTVVSLVMMTIAVHNIGSTPTAVLGALEPLTAVVIGVTVFGEAFTVRLACGILLVLLAVLLIVGGKAFDPRRLVRPLARPLVRGGIYLRNHFWWR